MLLEQVPQSRVEDADEVVVSWSVHAMDIPEHWKAVVSRCLDPDPNKRIRLSGLVDFWKVVKRQERALLTNPRRSPSQLIPGGCHTCCLEPVSHAKSSKVQPN